MSGRKTDNITRVDIRIPNELYDEIQAIAIQYFNAKIHHRSNRPEVTPTILKLIKIGIAHLDTSLPATDKKETDELREAIAQFNTRLTKVENQLSNIKQGSKSYKVEEQPTDYELHEDKVLTDMELSDILNVSNLLIRDYRLRGKKPRGQMLAKALTEEWEIKGDGWVKKD